MDLNLKEIRESGLLELYVLDDISQEDRAIIDEAISRFPELRNDIEQIERSLEFYAGMNAMPPPKGVWESIKSELPDKNGTVPGGMFRNFLLLLVFSVITFFLWRKNSSLFEENSRLMEQVLACEEQKQDLLLDNQIFVQLQDQNNAIVHIEATPAYPETDLYVHNNSTTGKVFLQISDLPDLAVGETFQLWSLKENSNPIPLEVFTADDKKIIEFTFEQNTLSYAITIEPEGGSQVPTLDKLIGVFNL